MVIKKMAEVLPIKFLALLSIKKARLLTGHLIFLMRYLEIIR